MPHRLKVPVVRTAEFTISLEQFDDLTLIHCDVHAPWSKGVLGRLNTAFEDLLRLHGGPIHALHTPGDRKHQKFLALFGFRYTDEGCTVSGDPVLIYTRTRKRI